MHCLQLVYSKNYFNLKKTFVLKLFKMTANQTMLQAWTEVYHQIFVSWEVQTMWNLQKNLWCVWRKCFVKKVFSKGSTWVCYYEPKLNRQFIEWKHSNFPVKKNFWVQQSVKKVMLTTLWDMKGAIIIDFLEKRYNCKHCFLLPVC